MTTTTKIKKVSRGQAARVENLVDLNVAFSRAHTMFLRTFRREPNWPKASTKLLITQGSVVCEIQEE